MAKRKDATEPASGGPTPDTVDQRVVAFAEHLGRIAGTFHGKAKGWMDREAVTKQISDVRDRAAQLLEHLAETATNAPRSNETATAALKGAGGRSGGVVDAPGKRHRKPSPTDPGANIADSQAAKMRTARTMVKTRRRRGRG